MWKKFKEFSFLNLDPTYQTFNNCSGSMILAALLVVRPCSPELITLDHKDAGFTSWKLSGHKPCLSPAAADVPPNTRYLVETAGWATFSRDPAWLSPYTSPSGGRASKAVQKINNQCSGPRERPRLHCDDFRDFSRSLLRMKTSDFVWGEQQRSVVSGLSSSRAQCHVYYSCNRNPAQDAFTKIKCWCQGFFFCSPCRLPETESLLLDVWEPTDIYSPGSHSNVLTVSQISLFTMSLIGLEYSYPLSLILKYFHKHIYICVCVCLFIFCILLLQDVPAAGFEPVTLLSQAALPAGWTAWNPEAAAEWVRVWIFSFKVELQQHHGFSLFDAHVNDWKCACSV